MKRVSEILIKLYQAFSSTREPRCKYYPSCSNYAATAIRRYGIKGLVKSSWRLLRCNPWSEGGLDYVDYELDSADALAKVRTTMVLADRKVSSNSRIFSNIKEGVL